MAVHQQAAAMNIRHYINLCENRARQDFWEMESEMADRMFTEYKSGTPAQPWKVIPAKRIIAIWKNAAKAGFMLERDEKALQQIADLMVENVMRLYINTQLAGHGTDSSEVVFQNLGLDDEIENVEAFVDWCVDYPGGWRISDYGLEDLIKGAIQLLDDPTSDQQLVIIDTMLSVTHQRSDLASWFVEGGTSTLNRLRDE